MSTLKKALQKAKAERERYRSDAGDDVTRRSLQGAPLESAPVDLPQQENSAPLYYRTRVLDIPRQQLVDRRIIAVDETHPLADVYKMLRTRVLQHTRPRRWNTILVTGFAEGEGKSTTAANLAVSIAQDTRQTVLLVDLDLRKPSVARVFGLNSDLPGLEGYFLEGMPLEEIFICPGIEKLTVLPTRRRVAESTEIVGSPAMEKFIRELKDRYEDRYIVLDSASLNDCSDSVILTQYVDAVLLVARAGHTRSEDVKAAIELIPRDKIIGVVYNGTDESEVSPYH